MQKLSSQPKARLFPIILQYETVQGNTVSYSSLTQLTLLQLDSQFRELPSTLKVNTIIKALTNSKDISKLIMEDVDILYNKILEVSIMTNEELNDIAEALFVLDDEKYATKEFQSCSLCQEKGLDKIRNCPMLDESTHNKNIVPYTFTNDPNRLTRVCPMYKVNNSEDIPRVFELMTMLELHTLPLSGGMLEQTPFVYEVSKIIKPMIDRKNIPMMF